MRIPLLLVMMVSACLCVVVSVSGEPMALPGSMPPAPVADVPTANPEIQRVAEGNNRFGWRLYAELAKTPGNLVFSPFSIHVCFGMPFAGAAGKTADEIQSVMGFPRKGDRLADVFGTYLRSFRGLGRETTAESPYTMAVANAIWAHGAYPFDPAYLKIIKDLFSSELHAADFAKDFAAIRTEINGWVLKVTHDKIKDLIPQGALTAMTRLVLVNAIYFKGKWADQFAVEATRDQPFFTSESDSVPVPMMHKTGSWRYFENAMVQMVALPYRGNEVYMYVVLPKAKTGLGDVEKTFAADAVAAMINGCGSQRVELSLPKFKVDSGFALPAALQALGIRTAFGEADFSRMLDPVKGKGAAPLVISDVFHKAFVAVDEEGTEAAAATAIVMKARGAARREEPPKVFCADHPFVWFIRHEATGAILFVGRVAEVKKE